MKKNPIVGYIITNEDHALEWSKHPSEKSGSLTRGDNVTLFSNRSTATAAITRSIAHIEELFPKNKPSWCYRHKYRVKAVRAYGGIR
jgi:hypothetical protein